MSTVDGVLDELPSRMQADIAWQEREGRLDSAEVVGLEKLPHQLDVLLRHRRAVSLNRRASARDFARPQNHFDVRAAGSKAAALCPAT
jgi:hypothetical protein